jgi:hypothetical protein
MNQLTTTQQELLTKLEQEFIRLNKPTENVSNVFSIAMINATLDEKKNANIAAVAYNDAMRKTLKEKFEDELTKFKKEFGEVLTIEDSEYKNLFDKTSNINTISLKLISKTKFRTDYPKEKLSVGIYVKLKNEYKPIILSSGENYNTTLLSNLEFDYGYNSNEITNKLNKDSSLYGLLTKNLPLRQQVINLV